MVSAGIFAFVLVQVALCSSLKQDLPRYLITAPSRYELGKTHKLRVDLFGSKTCDVVVSILGGKNQTELSTAKTMVTPGTPENLQLMLPSVSYVKTRSLKLQATICGKTTEKTRISLAYQRQRKNVFIQTDKPIYKPGQRVRMRVISIDENLRPHGDMVKEVIIEEPSGSRVMQWKDVKLEDGLASLQLLLSKEPVLGTWKIKAVVGETTKKQTIEVKKYVLPKYEVIITPPFLAKDKPDFTTTICAKYTYGKPVQGTMKAHFCFKHMTYQPRPKYRSQQHSICYDFTKELKKDGCSDVTLTRDELGIANVTNRWSVYFEMNAAVTEKQTGITLKNSKTIRTLSDRSYEFSFDATSKKFKPGLPFEYQLQVTTQGNKPATGVDVRVTINRDSYYNSATVFYNKTFTMKNGLIKEFLPNIAYNAKNLHFRAELLTKNPFPTKGYNDPLQRDFQSNAWYSPSLSYLQVTPTSQMSTKVGGLASLKVTYTVRNDTGKTTKFYYNVYCRGSLYTSGVHVQHHAYVIDTLPTTPMPTTKATTKATTPATPAATASQHTSTLFKSTLPTLKAKKIAFVWPGWRPRTAPPLPVRAEPFIEQFKIRFPVSQDMVPLCRVLVYYVRKDFETVADATVYDIEDRLENQVSVDFSDKEKRPGEKTKLIMKAKPGSRVAVVAVDKSVHLLRSGNELTRDKVMPLLRRFDSGETWNTNQRCNRYRPMQLSRRPMKRSVMPIWGGYYGPQVDDASDAFNEAGVIFLTNLKIHTKPCPRLVPVARMMLAENNVGNPGPSGNDKLVGESSKPVDKSVRVRKEFPETWLWTDEKISNTGEKIIEVQVPDTITTWVANGFAMSADAGLGVSETAHIKAFQPFFVHITLPYSVVRGEEIPVTVTVFNYMPTCMPVKLQLNKKSLDYNITSYHIHKMCVCDDSGKSFKFTIIPITLGKIDIEVKASRSSAKMPNCPVTTTTVNMVDKIIKKLLVEPEGITQEYSKGSFFCPNVAGHSETFDLNLPKEIVPGSVYSTVSIIGDVMGPALSNLDKLLRMPYGCGEQNMANFAPNIYIMDYLTSTGQVTKEIKDKAEYFMTSGYQRELIYKRTSGSYSAFGNRDKKGSMMLTAFVVRSFARAKNYVFIDDKKVEDSMKWFHGKQLKSGCFPNYGKVFHRGLQGGVDSELTITAYVTIALLEAGKTTSHPMVANALSCLESRMGSIKKTYTTALVSYLLVLAKHPKAAQMLQLLRSKAVKHSNQMYWTSTNKPTVRPSTHQWYYYRPPTAEVEMTGYALMAILTHGGDSQTALSNEVIQIVKWLSKQRNSYGGFSSTQDTCVALQALSQFAALSFGTIGQSQQTVSKDLTLSLQISNFAHTFTITKHNKLVLQRLDVPPEMFPNKMTINGKGTGCALFQTTVKYNIPKPEEIPAFDLKVKVVRRQSKPDEENTACHPLRLQIDARWLGKDVSNMAVVDIKLVTGFSVRESSLKMLENDPSLNYKRHDIEGKNVMIYFDEIKDIRFHIDIVQDQVIKESKPAEVHLYDYYDPEQEAKVMYTITNKDCYGDKIDTMCPKCIELDRLRRFYKMVDCNTSVSRIRSMFGKIKVTKSYTGPTSVKNDVMIPYEIPEFCPCQEIYDNLKSLVIGKTDPFKMNSDGMKMVFNADMTIIKWKPKDMKKDLETKIRNIKKRCKLRQNGN